MEIKTFENLDLACAMQGKIVAEKPSKERESLITNALAVLEEQGPYAMFLFLKARKGIAEDISSRLHDFLKTNPKQHSVLLQDGDIFQALQGVSGDLDKLLLARDLLRQTLVYARYHARLREEEMTP